MIAQGQETRRKETKAKQDNKINKINRTNDIHRTQYKIIYIYKIYPHPNTKVHEADERKLSHAKQE